MLLKLGKNTAWGNIWSGAKVDWKKRRNMFGKDLPSDQEDRVLMLL